MRIAGTFSGSRSVGRNLCASICFCLGVIRRGALQGLPFCFAGCVGFIEMLELDRPARLAVDGPSGVPFIEMLEFIGRAGVYRNSPSGVPFIEMLEFG